MAPSLHALLIDLDGVIYVQEHLIPGSLDVLHAVRARKLPHRFVTNTTSMSRQALLQRLSRGGLSIPEYELFTAPLATAAYLRGIPGARCFFFTNPDVLADFDGIAMTEANPTHVVVGDVGEAFSYANMNRVFHMLMEGAELVAFQKNRYWLTRDGLVLDAGAFVAALEYATGKEAKVFGKPGPEFFHQACQSMGLPPATVTMIGDDLNVDIAGAAKAGLQTVFVRTGKDAATSLDGLRVQPDLVLNSIADLLPLL